MGVSSGQNLAVAGNADELPQEALCRVLKKQTSPLIFQTSLGGLKRHCSSRWKMHIGSKVQCWPPPRAQATCSQKAYPDKEEFSDLKLAFVLPMTATRWEVGVCLTQHPYSNRCLFYLAPLICTGQVLFTISVWFPPSSWVTVSCPPSCLHQLKINTTKETKQNVNVVHQAVSLRTRQAKRPQNSRCLETRTQTCSD